MAGLVAAARAAELGASPVLLERGTRPGGSLLLSSGVVWRHRTAAEFGAECPGGDVDLQRLIVERLDEAIAWLRSRGAPVVAEQTGNPLTTGVRFQPAGLVAALLRGLPPVELGRSPGGARPLVLATGGFAARFARRHGLLLRAAPWSDGGGIELARRAGAAGAGDPLEFYGRALPAPPARIGERDFVRAGQLYGRHAVLVDERGRPVLGREPSWHETDLVQAIARLPGATAWYVVDGAILAERVGSSTVGEMIRTAEELGGEVRRALEPASLGLGRLDTPTLRTPPLTAVHVQASVTHTYAGVRVDVHGRVLDESGAAVPGLYAAGADVGGIFTGGYGSGLAAALVLGLAAAESAVASR